MSAPSPSADRNLLFGLLALQMDFLSRDQLVEAMNAWMLEKDTPLGEILLRRGVLDEDDRADIDKLVAKHVKRHGGARASLAAVRVEPAVHASLAGLADPDVQASLGPPPAHADPYGTVPPAGDPAPPSMRYDRLRPHARGGLGEVSVARDRELGREVALKEIQERFADHPDSRARFVREAEITGHLEHPGVVPVYGLGIYPDGRPYYAMRFVRGESLHEAVARFHQADTARRDPGERSLALRELLNRFLAVCDAVGYAHSRGVIHRDIKPANVMLGEYGETLVVDWGLARVLDRPEGERTLAERPVVLGEGSGSATQMGQAVGTPGFMPPEQAAGKLDELGPASDVFSLGGILYAILTGGAPHPGPSPEEALRQAQRGELAPARQRNPRAPRALEAVCARAMRAAAAERYPTARALAEEVRRWLADEPVQAYREPVADRARRWARRHRTLVTTAVALLLAGVVGLSIGLWAVNAEKRATAEALAREKEAKEEAEENLKLARQAIDECYNVAATHPLFKGPRMEKQKKLLLEKTLPFYKRFRAKRPEDHALLREEADQWARVGDIEAMLGDDAEAARSYEQARLLFVRLTQAQPGVLSHHIGLANVYNSQAWLYRPYDDKQDIDEKARHAARKAHNEALAVLAAVADTGARSADYWHALADTHTRIGGRSNSLNNWEEARKHYQQAYEFQKKAVDAAPADPEHQRTLANHSANLCEVLINLSRRAEVVDHLRLLYDRLVQLDKIGGTDPVHRNALASLRYNISSLLIGLREKPRAVKEARNARDEYAKLVVEFPDVLAYRENLREAQNRLLGYMLEVQNDLDDRLPEFRRIHDVFVAVSKSRPHDLDDLLALSQSHLDLSAVLENLGRKDDAMAELLRARDALARGATLPPDDGESLAGLMRTYAAVATAFTERLAEAEAKAAARRAAALYLKHVDLASSTPGERSAAAHQIFLLPGGEKGEVLAARRKAIDVVSRLVKDHPDAPDAHEDQDLLASFYERMGESLAEPEAALGQFELARGLRQKMTQARPDEADHHHQLARLYHRIGTRLAEQGKRAQAKAEFDAAHSVLRRLLKDAPKDEDHLKLACEVLRGRIELPAPPGGDKQTLADLDELVALADRMEELPGITIEHIAYLTFAVPRRAALRTRLGLRREADADWERLLEEAPEDDRGPVRLRRADSRARAGDTARSAQEAEQLASEGKPDGETLYALARIQAVNAAHAAKDTARPLPEREKRAATLARAAVALLVRAAAADHFAEDDKAATLDSEADLAVLRDRADYRAFRQALKPR